MDTGALHRDRPLTDEEFAQLEKQLLEATRAFFRLTQDLCGSIGDQEPELARRLGDAAGRMLLNVELAASEGEPGPVHTEH